MEEIDSNYDYISCPFCHVRITSHEGYNDEIIDLEDDEENFYICPECKKYVKISVHCQIEYDYASSKPTEEEKKQHNLIETKVEKEKIIEDIPGQNYFWDDFNK
jgi:hypothetical protein